LFHALGQWGQSPENMGGQQAGLTTCGIQKRKGRVGHLIFLKTPLIARRQPIFQSDSEHGTG